MSSRSSILAHIALQFAKHPENLATEGMAYILGTSKAAAEAVSHLLSQICAETGQHELSFVTQASNDDGSRPDLVGRDRDGRARLFVEAKFWAGLTDRQPVDYLRELPAPGVLLFVAPERRLTFLWQELEGRLRAAELQLTNLEACPARAVRFEGKTVALVSWRMLLERIHSALEAAGDHLSASDVRQLSALCDRMDSEAFIPLTAEELNPTFGKRVLEYCQLVDDVTAVLVASGDSDVTSLRATGGRGWYGRYQVLGRRVGAFLHFSPDAWAEWGRSPIWVTLKTATSGRWVLDPSLPTRLQLAGEYFEADHEGCHVPLEISAGREWHDLVETTAQRCRHILNLVEA